MINKKFKEEVLSNLENFKNRTNLEESVSKEYQRDVKELTESICINGNSFIPKNAVIEILVPKNKK